MGLGTDGRAGVLAAPEKVSDLPTPNTAISSCPPSLANQLQARRSEVRLERRVRLQGGEQRGAHDATGLDIAGVMDAVDRPAVAIGRLVSR